MADNSDMTFKQAFRAARQVDGKPNFTWRGKTYTTDVASDTPKKVSLSSGISGPQVSDQSDAMLQPLDAPDIPKIKDTPASNAARAKEDNDTRARTAGATDDAGDEGPKPDNPTARSKALADKIAANNAEDALNATGEMQARARAKAGNAQSLTGMKRGGAVKKKAAAPKKRSIDGIAQRGKTRAKRS